MSAVAGATAGAVSSRSDRRGVRSVRGEVAAVSRVSVVVGVLVGCLREPLRFGARAGFSVSLGSEVDSVGSELVGGVGALGVDDVVSGSSAAVVGLSGDGDVLSLDDEELESDWDGSAQTGPAATADPIPSATANAPTRPMYLADPTAATSFADSVEAPPSREAPCAQGGNSLGPSEYRRWRRYSPSLGIAWQRADTNRMQPVEEGQKSRRSWLL